LKRDPELRDKIPSRMIRTQLSADPSGRFVHDLILESCRSHGGKTALLDTSNGRRISYAEYGAILESLAQGMIAKGVKSGDVVAIFLFNSWEFCAVYHATTMVGAIPTLLNPSYREREVRYQLEYSGASVLVTDGPQLDGIGLWGLPQLRAVYTTRNGTAGTLPFSDLLKPSSARTSPSPASSSEVLAALPYSSGTTGLPKGVMLTHYNLVANVFQLLGPDAFDLRVNDTLLCFLPLYHIYGLNVGLNPVLMQGATLVLMARFNLQQFLSLLVTENVTLTLVVPPALLALLQAAEAGQFPSQHSLRWVKSGAAPLARELPRRFSALTGISIVQGYGMTEASPVTHLGFLAPDLYQPESVGQPLALTECRVMDDHEKEADVYSPGELVMRGPQFMAGYWRSPETTVAALRDGLYWSGDVVRRDERGFYYVVDRRKEMIKYKGFAVAPAEVEAVLLEHPAVRDCGVVSGRDTDGLEIPVAFIVLRPDFTANRKMEEELCSFVADRLTHYKQPRRLHFVEAIPKTASGKILRRELKNLVS